MVLASLQTPIAEKQFVVEASQERVWDFLGIAIFHCLPGLEKMDIVNERAFRAVLRWRLAFISLTFDLEGELVDISDPDFLGCVISAKSKWGVIQQHLKVTFALRSINKDKTEVVCRAMAEEAGIISRWILMRMQQSLAEKTLDCIKGRLEQLS